LKQFNKLDIIYSIIPLIVILVAWELMSSYKLIQEALFSKPSYIFETMIKLLISGSLMNDIYISIKRLIISFLIAAFIGTILGLLMGWNKQINDFFDPLITFLMPIPGIAWAPIFLVWFGFGDPTIIPVGILAGFFPIVQNANAATKAIDQKIVWAAQSMGARSNQIVLKVLLPNSAPYILTGFKLGLARAWRTIIAVELIAGSNFGLGAMIFTAREFLQPYKIYGGIIILALIYLAIELIIRFIEINTIEKWGMVDVGVLHGK
jgi:ABC-type nitrate/sulfonate/bicarbonate transport system permease component